MKWLRPWLVFVAVAVLGVYWVWESLLVGSEERAVFEGVIEERAELAAEPGGEVLLGAAGTWADRPDILDGMTLAVEGLNAEGGLLGRPVRLVSGDDQGSEEGALRVAQGFCSEPRMPVVLGHTDPALSRATAQNYAYFGLLSLAPSGSNPSGAHNHLQRTFANGLSPEQTAEAAVALAVRLGWHNIGLLYADSEYGSRLARRFEAEGDAKDILCMTGILPRDSDEDREDLRQWLGELGIDAVIVTGSEAQERRVVEVCSQGLDVPVLLGHERGAGNAPYPPRARVWAVRRLDAGGPAWRDFAAAFAQRFGRAASLDAASGWDAVMLVAQAARRAGSLTPDALGAALLNQPPEASVTGTVKFDADGNAVKGPLAFEPVDDPAAAPPADPAAAPQPASKSKPKPASKPKLAPAGS